MEIKKRNLERLVIAPTISGQFPCGGRKPKASCTPLSPVGKKSLDDGAKPRNVVYLPALPAVGDNAEHRACDLWHGPKDRRGKFPNDLGRAQRLHDDDLPGRLIATGQ